MSDLKKVAPRDIALAERFLPYADQLPESARTVLADIILTGYLPADTMGVRVSIREKSAQLKNKKLSSYCADGDLSPYHRARVYFLYHLEGKKSFNWRGRAVACLNRYEKK